MTFEDLLDKVTGLLGRSFPCRCGRTHVVQTQAVALGPGALSELPDLAERYFPPGPVLLIADVNTFAAAGERTLEMLRQVRQADALVLGREGDDVPVGDESHVRGVEARLGEGYAAAVGVGSGTVNDLGKLAATRAGVPYGVVATAASMNGYTSAIAAIISGGLKRTLSATPAVWVLGDLDVVAAAPVDMTRAGLADLMSKPSSTADWRAAGLILDQYYCPFCAELAGEAEAACRARAADIGRAEPEAVGFLLAGLILSGLSMAMAGSSSPASGGEHLISHVWDMRRLAAGLPHALHGFQAGMGTLMTSALWQLLRDVPRPDATRIEEIVISRPSWEEEAELIHERLGPLAGPSLEEYRAKRPDDDELWRRLRWLSEHWEDFWREETGLLRAPDEIRADFELAGIPTTVTRLGYSVEEARSAFGDARFIRSRFTVFDLATDLGVLDELSPAALDLSGALK